MPPNDLITLAEAERPTLSKLLEGHASLTPDKLIQLLLSATKISYYLRMVADPRQGHPETLIAALLQAAAVGLEPNTPLQHCALIPRKAKDGKWTANFQLMFRGRMHLATVHGGILDWQGEAVYKQDHFLYRPSSRTDPIDHIPELDTPKRPEDLRGAYVIVTLPSGARRAKWMPIAEIMSIAKRSSDSYKAFLSDRNKDDTPWVQRPGEMAIKTVANNIYKQIVLTSPPAIQIGGQVWERGPAAAARIPDEDEIEDAELTEDERPRAKGAHHVEIDSSETATPGKGRTAQIQTSDAAQTRSEKSHTESAQVSAQVGTGGDGERGGGRLATVLEAVEDVDEAVEETPPADEPDRNLDAREEQDIEKEIADVPPLMKIQLFKKFGLKKSLRELRLSQIPEFLAAAQAVK